MAQTTSKITSLLHFHLVVRVIPILVVFLGQIQTLQTLADSLVPAQIMPIVAVASSAAPTLQILLAHQILAILEVGF